jgi:glyoxylase-like metal-dependent hydrolase (beta-lactamase superfamily II)
MIKKAFIILLLAATGFFSVIASPIRNVFHVTGDSTKGKGPVYKVYAIRFASSGYPFTVADWADGAPKTEKVKIDFMVWLIKGNNGKNILVDAGFLGDTEDAQDFKIISYIRPDSALLKLGVQPGDITDVILSHPHWDHIDGINLFPNARFWIQKKDFEGFVGTAWQKKGSNGGFAKRDVRKLVDLNLDGKVTFVEGDNKPILPGITVYTGSKHTFNSQYVVVETGINKVLLASDNVWIYYNIEHLAPASSGGTLDPSGYIKAMQRMKTLVSNPRFIIPGHDAAVFSRFSMLMDGVAEIK